MLVYLISSSAHNTTGQIISLTLLKSTDNISKSLAFLHLQTVCYIKGNKEMLCTVYIICCVYELLNAGMQCLLCTVYILHTAVLVKVIWFCTASLFHLLWVSFSVCVACVWLFTLVLEAVHGGLKDQYSTLLAKCIWPGTLWCSVSHRRPDGRWCCSQ